MGILGALNYSGPPQGGGLLEFLRTLQQGGQGFSGLPSDQAQYDQPPAQPMPVQAQAYAANQSSQLDNASWPAGPIGAPQHNPQPSPLDNAQWPFGPNGAPSQANAQMPPAQPPAVIPAAPVQPATAQPAGQDAGNPLMAGIQSWANTPGGILGRLANGVAGFSSGQRTDPAAAAQQQQTQVQNLTFQALVKKGVDPQIAQAAVMPGNTELLKNLVDENFKTKTPMNMGSGYIYDPGAKRATRLFEPDEKTPAGFVKDDSGNMKFIPGGPADPAYIQLAEAKKKDPNGVYTLGRGGELYKIDKDGNPVIVHKNEDGMNAEPTIDDKSAKLLAERVLMGDTKALVGLGRGAQGSANLLKIHKLASDIADEKGIDARGVLNNVAQQAGLVSATRAMGTKEAHFGVAEKAMEESLPLARAASAAVPRTEWRTINKLIQMGQTEHNDPLLKKLLIATDTAAKDYARTINPTGVLRESDIEYARKILSTVDSEKAYNAALDQLQLEAGVMHRAIQRQKAEFKGDHAGAAQTSHLPAPQGINKTKSGVSWTVVP